MSRGAARTAVCALSAVLLVVAGPIPGLPPGPAAPASAGGDCRGCVPERRADRNWSGGVEVTLPKDGPASVLAAGIVAEAGRCRIHGRCFVWRDCRWTVWALIANHGPGDLWFDTPQDYVQLPIPGLSRPDAQGRVRVPKGGMALFVAGSRPLPCDAAWQYRGLALHDGQQRQAGTLRWSARCSRCEDGPRIRSGALIRGRIAGEAGG